MMPLLVCCSFLFLGLYVLIWNEKRRKLADSSRSWRVVIGRIVESRVQHARPKMDESDSLIFAYQYQVDGVDHIGTSLDLFEIEKRISLQEMEAVIQTYPQGGQVPIHYDASAPSVSVIEPGNRLGYARNRNLGVLVMLIGLLSLGALSHLEKW